MLINQSVTMKFPRSVRQNMLQSQIQGRQRETKGATRSIDYAETSRRWNQVQDERAPKFRAESTCGKHLRMSKDRGSVFAVTRV